MNIPGYEIEHEIGQGGMATVFLATHVALERKVALKIMSPALVADRSFCERFLKEGKIVAQLNHPNIVTIFDIGVSEHHYYMAMEYVAGGQLKDNIGQPMAPKRALEIIKELAAALGYAHQQGFVHRDVKPANILFRESGMAVLSDFGIAKATSGDTQLTRMGLAIGTPDYMSPEQALGKPVDGRSDLYSLGVVLYEMLTGYKPYEADDTFATTYMHLNTPVPELPKNLNVLQATLARLMAKNPVDRFANADELIEVASELAAQPTLSMPDTKTRIMPDPGATRAVGGLAPASSRASRGTRWGALAAAAALLVGVAGYLYAPPLKDLMGSMGSMSPMGSGSGDGGTTGEQTSALENCKLSPDQREKVARLLQNAEAYASMGRLTEPPGFNAVEAYKLVLEICPTEPNALKALRDIDRLVAQKAQTSETE